MAFSDTERGRQSHFPNKPIVHPRCQSRVHQTVPPEHRSICASTSRSKKPTMRGESWILRRPLSVAQILSRVRSETLSRSAVSFFVKILVWDCMVRHAVGAASCGVMAGSCFRRRAIKRTIYAKAVYRLSGTCPVALPYRYDMCSETVAGAGFLGPAAGHTPRIAVASASCIRAIGIPSERRRLNSSIDVLRAFGRPGRLSGSGTIGRRKPPDRSTCAHSSGVKILIAS